MGESGEEPEEPFQIKDLGLIFSSKVFWIVCLTVRVYIIPRFFPSMKYAINILQCNLDFSSRKSRYDLFCISLRSGSHYTAIR